MWVCHCNSQPTPPLLSLSLSLIFCGLKHSQSFDPPFQQLTRAYHVTSIQHEPNGALHWRRLSSDGHGVLSERRGRERARFIRTRQSESERARERDGETVLECVYQAQRHTNDSTNKSRQVSECASLGRRVSSITSIGRRSSQALTQSQGVTQGHMMGCMATRLGPDCGRLPWPWPHLRSSAITSAAWDAAIQRPGTKCTCVPHHRNRN